MHVWQREQWGENVQRNQKGKYLRNNDVRQRQLGITSEEIRLTIRQQGSLYYCGIETWFRF